MKPSWVLLMEIYDCTSVNFSSTSKYSKTKTFGWTLSYSEIDRNFYAGILYKTQKLSFTFELEKLSSYERRKESGILCHRIIAYSDIDQELAW